MYIKNKKETDKQPNPFHDKEGNIVKYKQGYRTSTGHRETIYDMKKYHRNDFDEAVREIEERMIRYCDKNHLDWATIDKFDLAKKLGCLKEYKNAAISVRLFT